MSSNPKIDVRYFVKQEGNTCGAHSIYNYLVLTKKITLAIDTAAQKAAIAAIYGKITSSQTGEAALPHLMLDFLNKNGAAVALHGSNKFKANLEQLRAQLQTDATIAYTDDPFSAFLKPGAYGIALWNTTETFPPLTKLATMHYTVVCKNAAGDIYALDSNCPDKIWQLVGSQFTLNFMGLLFA